MSWSAAQRFIAAVIDRLQPFIKGKWKKSATDMKRRQGHHPDFDYLVKFVKAEADIAADPVYGDSGLLKFNCVSSRGNSDSVRVGSSGAGYNTGFSQQRSAGNQPPAAAEASFRAVHSCQVKVGLLFVNIAGPSIEFTCVKLLKY